MATKKGTSKTGHLKGAGSHSEQTIEHSDFLGSSEKNGADYLSWTPDSASSEKDSGRKFTWSAWVKRESTGSEQALFSAGGVGRLQFDEDDHLLFQDRQGGVWKGGGTSEKYTNTDVWFHIVLSVDTTQEKPSDRIRIFIDGRLQTDSGLEQCHARNDVTVFGARQRHEIGSFGAADHFDGLLAFVEFVDGRAVTASSFGEKTLGHWRRREYAYEYGAHGFRLDFANPENLGADVSGNGNRFAPTTSIIRSLPAPVDDERVRAGHPNVADQFIGQSREALFTRTASRRKSVWSAWVRRESNLSELASFGAEAGSYRSRRGRFRLNSENQPMFHDRQSRSGIGKLAPETTIDTRAWYHVVLSVDTATTNIADRVKFTTTGFIRPAIDRKRA